MSTLKANNFQSLGGNQAFDITDGYVNLSAGTAEKPAFKFNSGVLLATPVDGTISYDGYGFYATPHSESGRGFIEVSHFYKLSANRTILNATGAQSLFGAGITLASNTSYQFETLFTVNTTGATSNALGFNISGTASIPVIQYRANTTNGTSATTANTSTSVYVQTVANTNITAAVAAATQRVCFITGTFDIGTGGTFIPNIQYSAAPGAAPVVQSGAFIKIKPLNEITENSVGAWA
jgi:hypothetical protein